MSKIYLGKRKRAIARIRMLSGKKNIIINNRILDDFPEIVQLKIKEPLIIAEDENFDIKANVKGGGIMGQAEAVAQAIARGLIDIKGEELKKKILEYDRNLLIQDVRRTEPHKPSRSKKGPRRHKQRSKR
jgi:small subunit ribosomal protein S9